MKLFAGALCLTALLASPSLAEPCQSIGDPGARSVGMAPPPPKGISPSVAWTFLVAEKLGSVRVNRTETCERGPFRLGGQVFRLSGENRDAIPRKAVSVNADGPVVMLVPLSVQHLRLNYPGLVPKGKAGFYMIAVWENGVLTAERVLQGIPTDELLVGEFGLALTKVNTMAKIGPGDRQPTLIIKGLVDQTPSK